MTCRVSEEIEGRVTEKLSQELRRIESRFWAPFPGEMSFFRTHKLEFTPDLFRRHPGSNGENQETNEDRSQNDPHPEVSLSESASTRIEPGRDFLQQTTESFQMRQKSQIKMISVVTPT